MAELIPWYDDWWSVKPNEFERGVMTGMLLGCGKKGEEEKPQQPESSSNWKWYKTPAGVLIETWAYSKEKYYWGGSQWDKVYLKQRKTYSDGTYFEWESLLSTYQAYGIQISRYNWELLYGEPNANGCITNATLHCVNKDDPTITMNSNVYLKWNIPTTEPKVIT